MILRPFHQILACVLYVVPWIAIAGLDIYQVYVVEQWFNIMGFYTNNGLMGYGLASMFADQTIIYFGILVTLLAIAFLIPVVIIIITCILQVICLCRSSQFPASPNQRHVTITVILMSSLFVICNSALYGYVFLTLLGLTQPDPATIIRYSVRDSAADSRLRPESCYHHIQKQWIEIKVSGNSEERSNKFEKTVFEQSKCRNN